MLTIRLTRKGKKNQPFFRIVVIDKRRSAKGGRAVEELGYVNPLTKKNSIEKERVLYWISKGAKPTPRIHNLLVSEKVISAKKINVFKVKKSKTATTTAPATPVAPASEASAPVPVAEVKTEPVTAENSDVAKETPKPAETPTPVANVPAPAPAAENKPVEPSIPEKP